MYTHEQAPGAIPKGTAIVKAVVGDPVPAGTKGTVCGSISAAGAYAYFIEWETMKGVPVFVEGYKIKRDKRRFSLTGDAPLTPSPGSRTG